jgi:hypothetical protein
MTSSENDAVSKGEIVEDHLEKQGESQHYVPVGEEDDHKSEDEDHVQLVQVLLGNDILSSEEEGDHDYRGDDHDEEAAPAMRSRSSGSYNVWRVTVVTSRTSSKTSAGDSAEDTTEAAERGKAALARKVQERQQGWQGGDKKVVLGDTATSQDPNHSTDEDVRIGDNKSKSSFSLSCTTSSTADHVARGIVPGDGQKDDDAGIEKVTAYDDRPLATGTNTKNELPWRYLLTVSSKAFLFTLLLIAT